MSTALRVGGYVKLAKLWEKNRASAVELHLAYFEERCGSDESLQLKDVYIDITGNKHVYKREQMVALLKSCMDQEIDVIITPSRAYLAPNSQEFCYLLKFLFDLPRPIDIVSDDDDYRIDTILNVENQKENLRAMAEKFIRLDPGEYEDWKKRLLAAMEHNREVRSNVL